MSAIGTKRTYRVALHMSASGVKRTWRLRCKMSLLTQSEHWVASLPTPSSVLL
jgi:hypothetical protein